MKNRNRPNKCGSKGKQQIKPIIVPRGSKSEVSNKGATGLSEGTWKRRVTQSPCTNVYPSLGVEIGLKRKPEGFKRDVVNVKMHEKKKKVAEENNDAGTGEVAGQPHQDQ